MPAVGEMGQGFVASQRLAVVRAEDSVPPSCLGGGPSSGHLGEVVGVQS